MSSVILYARCESLVTTRSAWGNVAVNNARTVGGTRTAHSNGAGAEPAISKQDFNVDARSAEGERIARSIVRYNCEFDRLVDRRSSRIRR